MLLFSICYLVFSQPLSLSLFLLALSLSLSSPQFQTTKNMSRRACKRVSFNPNPEATDEPIFPKHDGLSSSHHSRRRVVLVGILSFGLRSSPAARKLIQRIGARFAKTLRFISFRRNTTDRRKTSSFLLPSSSSSSSSSAIYMKRSKSVNETESHRAEAIEDCIEFLNSSFPLSRSNSVSTWSSS